MVREASPHRTRAHLLVLGLAVLACLGIAVVPHDPPYAPAPDASGPTLAASPVAASPVAKDRDAGTTHGSEPAPEDVCVFGHE